MTVETMDGSGSLTRANNYRDRYYFMGADALFTKDDAGRSSRTLRILVRTNLTVLNREAVNVFMSYIGAVLGGTILAGVSAVPALVPLNRDAQNYAVMFLLGAAMMDSLGIQGRLAGTPLVDGDLLALFPLSRIRSIAYRFVLILLDRRLLYYLLPALTVAVILFLRGFFLQALIASLLYAAVYLIASEILLVIFPFLRKLAARYSARTVTQIVMLPFVALYLLPAIFHLPANLPTLIPVVSNFVRGLLDAGSADGGRAALEAGFLMLISMMVAVLVVASDFVLAEETRRSAHKVVRRSSACEGDRTVDRSITSPSRSKQRISREYVGLALSYGIRGNLSLIFLDWRISLKQERLIYMILVYPFLGVMLVQAIVRRLHHSIASLVFPIFLITQFLATALTENHFTKNGLHLNHLSTFPIDRKKIVQIKFLGPVILLSAVNLLTSLVIGLWYRVGGYQLLQGAIYSIYLPLIFLLAADSLVLLFNNVSRHPLISLLIIWAAEILATFVYVVFMLLNEAAGAAFIVIMLVIIYYVWMPACGKKLAAEFQTLLGD